MWLQDKEEKNLKNTSEAEETGEYFLWWLDYLGMENSFSEMCIECIVSCLEDWI